MFRGLTALGVQVGGLAALGVQLGGLAALGVQLGGLTATVTPGLVRLIRIPTKSI